jgi:16S rRNA (guanine527-N7)-methyltransferase
VATLSELERGIVVGLLIGEGSFGGDGKQPQITLRMHVRHEALFRWLADRLPDTRVYGPYNHGGRTYYQWMARGRVLVRDVLPLLEQDLHGELDTYASGRFEAMCERYAGFIERERARLRDSSERGLASLAGRYALPDRAGEQLAALTELLSNDPAAATTVRDPQRVLDDHLADALVALELAQVRAAASFADLGSGAGVPGLPLAIALPDAQVALVESNGRKHAFIERALSVCGVANAEAVHSRVESWAEGRERHDVVTARALAPLPVVAEYAAPLLRIGGALIVWRGRRDEGEEAAAARAAAELGLEPAPPLAVHPYPQARHRHLHVMTKVAPTPARFPRRPGAARKRPLS